MVQKQVAHLPISIQKVENRVGYPPTSLMTLTIPQLFLRICHMVRQATLMPWHPRDLHSWTTQQKNYEGHG